MLRLTLLVPEIGDAIVEGRPGEGVTLPMLMKGFAVEWKTQHIALAASGWQFRLGGA